MTRDPKTKQTRMRVVRLFFKRFAALGDLALFAVLATWRFGSLSSALGRRRLGGPVTVSVTINALTGSVRHGGDRPTRAFAGPSTSAQRCVPDFRGPPWVRATEILQHANPSSGLYLS
jgi:hypothetical protein